MNKKEKLDIAIQEIEWALTNDFFGGSISCEKEQLKELLELVNNEKIDDALILIESKRWDNVIDLDGTLHTIIKMLKAFKHKD